MDLVIVDGDCRNLWTRPELERLLDAGRDVVWFCEDAVLREQNYNAALAAEAPIGSSFEKAILVTGLQSGVMNYHKQMLRNTTGCKRWLIIIVGVTSTVYQKQFLNGIDSVIGGLIRYDVIFDDPSNLGLALEAKQEKVPDGKFCIIATGRDTCFAESVRETLESFYSDWQFACHVGMENDLYKYADVVLVIGRSEEDFAVPPAEGISSRLRVWMDIPYGDRKQDFEPVHWMNRNGWNIGSGDFWASCYMHEKLLEEFENGEISGNALCSDDRFVMWDSFGLPLPAEAYESVEKVEMFLRRQCCFPDLLDGENAKGEI